MRSLPSGLAEHSNRRSPACDHLFPTDVAVAFERLHNPDRIPAALSPAVVAIGNFDGVHRGHRALARTACLEASQRGAAAVALTFEPHSRVYLRPDEPFFALGTLEDKALLLERAGLAGLVVVPFDRQLVTMSAGAFSSDLLAQRLGATCVVVGADFRYGRGREGDVARLRSDGAALGFSVIAHDPVTIGARAVSSTAIRDALTRGDVATAAALLGHWWFVRAPVVHGDKRGRTLGYPTANQILPVACGLAHGIYAVRAAVSGRVLNGVASFGRRPTFDDGAPRLETFLFDFSGDLYGQDMAVEFVSRLRGEERFDSIETLIAQMDRDSAAARAALITAVAGSTEGIESVLPDILRRGPMRGSA
jgi:riboflavin kinase/FMN adenylyltransferase